ncbi:ribonuclease HII [Merdibacter massiliensis]|uniref:ribonuclease HII n=1 Tax=Merdibacter massiliensis TaxID=1871030 RepID=UPI00096AA02A|nr:ribonuclease HII [Merdibacter massiliensis]
MKIEHTYEISYWQQGYQHIIGLDEAGRGPIAGPLVVAGVRFAPGFQHDGIYDSKKVSEKKRELLFDEIVQLAGEYHILVVEPAIIDQKNIYAATQDAMQEIVDQFLQKDAVLTDAMPLPHCQLPMEAIVKGDQKSVSIAAASILAKVTRDRIMRKYDELYPQYGFAKHKGYPTKAHIAALHRYGVLDIYRKSYGPVKEMLEPHLDLRFDDTEI